MEKTTLAYIAGLFDGEGHVGINRHRVGGYVVHQPYASVSNCNLDLLEWVKEQMGGMGQIHKKTMKDPERHRQGYTWKVASLQLEACLTPLLPYLRLKKPQVEIALDFQRRVRERKAHKHSPLGDDERARRDEDFELLKRMNRPPIAT